MSVGRISGPLLKANLLRDGVDLAFENDLLYLDVNNLRVGINTNAPTHDLHVDGTTRTTYLQVDNQLDIGNITITGNTISSNVPTLNLIAAADGVIYQNRLTVDQIDIQDNFITTNTTNADLKIFSGTGSLKVYSDMFVDGNIHATGNITADGSIVLGDQNTDNIVFNADVNSDIIPNVTDFYDLGSATNRWNSIWTNNFIATNVLATNVIVDGVDVSQIQGNIIYVSSLGDNTNSGYHQNDCLATIEYALSLAVDGDTIYIYPGTYEENCPLTIPVGVTVKGASLRNTIITPSPSTRDQDVFLLNGETTVEDITIKGHFYNALNNTGHAFRFANGFKVTLRSPYIRNCSVISFGTPTSSSVATFQIQNDGSILRIKDIIDEIVTNGSITPSLGNIETQVTNLSNPSDGTTGTALQTLIDHILYILTNGASGSSLPAIIQNGPLTTDVVKLNAAALITSNIDFLKAEMVAWVEFNYPGFWGVYNQTTAERDLGIILDALIYDIQHDGNEESIKAGIGFWQYYTTDPRGYNEGDAGRGAFIDGSVADPTTNEASMLFHSVTFLCPGVDTITMTEGVRVEWLNCFTYWATKGLYAYSGTTGKGGVGQTILAVDGVSGVYNVGDTIEYYAEDNVTILGSGTIAAVSGSKIYINGKESGFVEYSSRVGKPVTVAGSAQISNSQAKFGGSSGQFVTATNDEINVSTNDDFAFGTGDFTVEFWSYFIASAATQCIFDMRSSGVAQAALTVEISSSGYLKLYVNGAFQITSALPLADNAWYHIAIARASSVTKMFINGTPEVSTYTDSNTYNAKPLNIGAYYNSSSHLNAYIDDFRISKGIARYTGSFVVPTAAFGADSYTVLLLHFDGVNGSTTFDDDSTLTQDIRFTPSGATATQFTLVDYADFGAEVRSIGSAAVYGDYGIYGDGEGVIMYLIGQNLAYIGLGGSQENDPLAVIQANEIVQLNDAKIYYSSVDHKGDFRVGDLFYVNQQTGAVEFTNSIVNIIGPAGITLSDGVNVTIVNPTKVETGDIRISGNTIQSLTNEVNITASNNNINLLNNVNISGNLDVVGNVTIGGNITLGDQTTDSVQFVAGIDSNLIPNLPATYNIGSDSLQWKDLWVRTAHISDIEISTNYIRTTVSNTDLELRANGTGSILVEDIRVNQNVVSTDSGNIQITPATTLDITASTTNVNGTMHVTGDVSIDANTTLGTDPSDNVYFNARVNSDIIPTYTSAYDLGAPTKAWKTAYLSSSYVDDILIDTNIIQTVVSNSNLELRANGTGSIQLEQTYVNENLIYTVGNNLLIQPATTLDITASTTHVNGDLHVTGNTSFDTNTTLGTDPTDDVVFNARVNSNIVPKYAATYDLGAASKAWNIAWLASAHIDDIYIDTNIITTTASNANLELRANGTGAIRVEKIDINENLIKTNGTDNLLIQPATTLDITASMTTINGALHVTGNSSFDGNLTFGTDATDNIVFNARVNSNIVPNYSGTYNLGSPSKNWKIAHLSSAYIDNIFIDTNIIRTTESNANLELKANGTGAIRVEQVDINENIISTNGSTNLILDPATTLDILGDTNITGDLNVTGNVTIGGNITVGDQNTDNITFAAEINSDIVPNLPVTYNLGSAAKRWKTLYAENTFISDIEINTNVIRTTVSNADLELRANGTGGIKLEDITVNQNVISAASGTNIVMQPSGTGIVDISTTQAIRLPRGTTAERPGTPLAGMIRYNTTNNNYEGYDGTYWRVINGLYDVDQNTYLVAEATPGANDNTFYFVSNGVQIADLTATRLNAIKVEVDNTYIDNNVVGTISNTNLTFTAAGTGKVIFENFSFKNNVITNTVTNGVTELVHAGTGYFKIAGTTGFRVPVGNAVQRPDTTINPTAFIGFTRYNTDDNRLEIFDGITWQSAAGTSSGVTIAQAEDIAIQTVLTLG